MGNDAKVGLIVFLLGDVYHRPVPGLASISTSANTAIT